MQTAVVQQAWVQMVARYGKPNHLTNAKGGGFAVVGYGKLGGWGVRLQFRFYLNSSMIAQWMR